MAAQIRPNRLEVTDRFPMLGFTIRTDGSPQRGEVAIATNPALFRPEHKSERTAANFYSSRASGPLAIPRGEAVYVVPPDVLARFIGQERLYVALATASDRNGGPRVDVMPGDGSPYVLLSGLTGRSLRRVRMVPSRQDRAAGYGTSGKGGLEWAGDAATPGTVTPTNGKRAAPATQPPPAPAPVEYDDGFGPLPSASTRAGMAPSGTNGSGGTTTGASPSPTTGASGAATSGPSAAPPATAVAKGLGLSDLAIGAERRTVTPPSVRRLSSVEATIARGVIAGLSGPFGPAIAALPAAARAGGVSIGLGPAVSGGLGAGVGLGVGVVFGPDGELGLYGAAEAEVGFLASISATAQITIVRGGIDSFNGWGVAATISGGEEVVGGASALFDTAGNFVGVSFQLGVGGGLTPIDFYVAIQRQVATQLALAQACLGVAPSGRLVEARALDLPNLSIGNQQPVTAPSVRRLSTGETLIARGAIAALSGPFGPVIAALPVAAHGAGVSIGMGPAVGGGLGAGIGLGVGIVFGPDGGLGLYGGAEVEVGFLASISATAQITIVRGGIESFNGWGMAATISGGEGVVGGASALFDLSGNFQGVSFQLGVGAGLTPVDFYIAIQRQVATELALAQAAGGAGVQLPSRRLTAVSTARALSTDIPLDPGNGGMSIGPDQLEIGDIILSTTSAAVSDLIRFGTGSDVSHAMLYVGQGGQVVDATGHGVRLRPLTEALADATVAVAFRYPDLSDDQRHIIADKVAEYIGRPYNYWGIVRQARFQVHRALCGVLPDAQATACRTFFGVVDLGRGTSNQFFCSQLVVAAYQAAGVPITDTDPSWASPDDLAQLSLRQGALAYIGHLKAPPYERRQSIWESLGFSLALRASGTTVGALGNESFTLNWDEVEAIPQPTNFSCWAAAAAMVVGWKELQSLSPDGIAQICSRTTASGLDPAQIQKFANEIGLTPENPQCYTIDGFRRLLESRGPLWVAANVPGLHAIVVTGMYADGDNAYVRITDPWDRQVGTPGAPGPYLRTHTTGSRYIMRWEDFVREYESAATDFSSVNLQILHADGTGGHTPNYGSAAGAGYAQALRAARAGAPRGSGQRYAKAQSESSTTPAPEGPPAPVRRVESGAAGDVRWTLEQYIGLRRPTGAGANNASVTPAERAVRLDDWPLVRLPEGDIQLPLTVAWRYGAGSVGDVAIRAGEPRSVAGWTTSVSADLKEGPDSSAIAAVGVRVRYTFSRSGRSDIVAFTELTLFGDGTYNRQDRWQQAEAGVA